MLPAVSRGPEDIHSSFRHTHLGDRWLLGEGLTPRGWDQHPLLPCSHICLPFSSSSLTKDHRKRPKYNKLLEHSFIKRYETLEVDVASWFKDVMAKTESPRTSGVLSQPHLPFFR